MAQSDFYIYIFCFIALRFCGHLCHTLTSDPSIFRSAFLGPIIFLSFREECEVTRLLASKDQVIHMTTGSDHEQFSLKTLHFKQVFAQYISCIFCDAPTMQKPCQHTCCTSGSSHASINRDTSIINKHYQIDPNDLLLIPFTTLKLEVPHYCSICLNINIQMLTLTIFHTFFTTICFNAK